MAIWQFSFNIVEKGFNDVKPEPVFRKLDEQSLFKIAQFLSIGNSWSNDIVMYGNDDTTCIELLYESDKLQEVLLRLDIRTISKELLIAILDFIKHNNAKIYKEKEIFEPTLENIINLIKKSKAYRFAKSPLEALSEIKTS